jgi:hypothetical protein
MSVIYRGDRCLSSGFFEELSELATTYYEFVINRSLPLCLIEPLTPKKTS